MEAAYLKASANGTLPANARQIMYAARPQILALSERDWLDDAYFCQTLLVDYMRENNVTWDVVWDDRGHFVEPHTEREIGLGTLSVRRYLRGNRGPEFEEAGFAEAAIKTHGPDGCYGAILFVEKEGFLPLRERARISEKFDIGLMTSKGMSVTAARHLADHICGKYNIPLLTLRDFDVVGFSISKTVGSDTRRYTFQSKIKVIELGLRLVDVEAMDLDAEPVAIKGDRNKIRLRLWRNGATKEEVDFLLREKRVELNAMTSDVFVAFVERKLTEHGIKKVIPVNDRLEEAFRLFARGQRIRQAVEDAIEGLGDEEIDVPHDLDRRVREYLEENPEKPWTEAVHRIADEEGE
jgi:hypothetical protein